MKKEIEDITCESCSKTGSRSRTTYLQQAPKNLIIRLQRADWDGEGISKTFTKVNLTDDKIDLSVCEDGGIPGDQAGSSYKLYAVIKHRGRV